MKYKVISRKHLVEDGINYKPGNEIPGMTLDRARTQEALHNVEIIYEEIPKTTSKKESEKAGDGVSDKS